MSRCFVPAGLLPIVAALVHGCGSLDSRVPDNPRGTLCGSHQLSADWESGMPPRQTHAEVELAIPDSILSTQDTVFSVASVDLDCNGKTDFVAQVLQAGRLLLIAYVNEDHGWRRVLSAPAVVEGPEVLVIAADLNADRMMDLVTWGQDEGGQVPRVFVSRAGTYQSVAVPREYNLRHEEAWSASCRRRVLPQLLPGNAIQLHRETISPEAALGHGADCMLPVDTLIVSGGRMELADPPKP